MTKGEQIRDLSHIDNVIVSLLDALNFNSKIRRKSIIWDFATGKNSKKICKRNMEKI